MKETMQYSDFHFIQGNRQLDERKVLQMMEAIKKKNLLKEFPIVVTPKMGILDGQHRFEAARRLGIPVCYIISSQISIDDVATVNRSILKWQLKDYIYLYATRGRESYRKLLNYTKQWNLSVDVIIRIFGADAGTYAESIRKGSFEFHPIKEKQGIELYNRLQDFSKYFDSWKNRGFVAALRFISKQSNYDHEIMKQKVEYQSRKIVKCVDTDAYIEMLVEIYNHKNQKKLEVRR